MQAAILARESSPVQSNVDVGQSNVEAVQSNDRVVQSNDRVGQSNVEVVQSNDRVGQSNVPSEEDVLGMWTSQPEDDDDAKAFAQVPPFLALTMSPSPCPY